MVDRFLTHTSYRAPRKPLDFVGTLPGKALSHTYWYYLELRLQQTTTTTSVELGSNPWLIHFLDHVEVHPCGLKWSTTQNQHDPCSHSSPHTWHTQVLYPHCWCWIPFYSRCPHDNPDFCRHQDRDCLFPLACKATGLQTLLWSALRFGAFCWGSAAHGLSPNIEASYLATTQHLLKCDDHGVDCKFGLGSNPSDTMHIFCTIALNLDLLKKALNQRRTLDSTSHWLPIGKIKNGL